MENGEDNPTEQEVKENGVDSYPSIRERGFYSEIVADENATQVEVSRDDKNRPEKFLIPNVIIVLPNRCDLKFYESIVLSFKLSFNFVTML